MHGRTTTYSELWDFREELRDLFEALERSPGTDPFRTDCVPAMDVYETDSTVEVALDLPGVNPATVRVFCKSSVLLVAGEKLPRRGQRDASFHLVERGFGRFARTLKLTCACDVAHATAQLRSGELRVSLPKLTDRRGRSFAIPVLSGAPRSPETGGH